MALRGEIWSFTKIVMAIIHIEANKCVSALIFKWHTRDLKEIANNKNFCLTFLQSKN